MILMRIHHVLGRLSSPFQQVGFFVYNYLFHVPRARVLVWNEQGQLLLVRNWGGKQQWGLPGGGVEKHEQPEQAAKRELYEEIGVDVPVDQFRYVVTLQYKYQAPIFTATIPVSAVPATPHNPWEITALEWFAPDQLPVDTSPLVGMALAALSKST